MPDPVPLSLFHTGRAQCPDCGAPLSLQDGRPRVRCQYCGAAAVVERRLRMIEPRPVEGFETLDAPTGAARGVRGAQVVSAIAQDESHCPTCGAEMAGEALQAIRRCAQCGTESKIERRLVRADGSAAEGLAEIEGEAEEFERRQLAQAEALINRIAKGALEDQLAATRELTSVPMLINARTARLLPQVLEVLRRCDPRLEIPLAEIVGKLLCSGDPRLANATIRAAEKFTFDVNGSRCLLFQLGLGTGIGLKLLLDTADYAGLRGATTYASTALWAVSIMLERNFADRVRLAEIVLYRLLYLRGPVQAWALELCKGQMGLGCRFSTPTILRFIDDCACERPELLPHVRKFFYTGVAATEAEYLQRVAFIDELLTSEAKCAALEQLIPPPESASDPAVAGVLERLLAYAKDPKLVASAGKAIADVIQDGMQPRECVHALVRQHGEALPEEVRRAYLRAVPDSKLLKPVPVQYWQPTREGEKVGFEKQLADWHDMWNQGIRDAVREMDEKRALARGS